MAQLIDTVWENGLWADTVWAAGVWGGAAAPEPEPEPEVTGNAGGTIVGGTFSRGKWRSIQDAKRAQRAAADHFHRLKAKKRKTLEEAAGEAKKAIKAAEATEAQEVVRGLDRMAAALDAARGAATLAEAAMEAQRTIALAAAVMKAIEDEREEEAVVTLLLM